MRELDFQTCMKMMRKSSPHSKEEGFHALLPQASKYLPELINEFQNETDEGLRRWLLELIGAAQSPETLHIFLKHLVDKDESLRVWAAYGLHKLNTKESRRALWEAQSYTFASSDETERFKETLRIVRQWK